MSSLRLALKQSLQESGQLGGKKPRSSRSRGTKSATGKGKKRRGDPPRKRGRPKGSHNRPHGGQSPRRRGESDDEEQHDDQDRDHDQYGGSSSEEENEFSAGDEDEEESEDDDEEEDGEEDEGDESDAQSRNVEDDDDQPHHDRRTSSGSNQRPRPEEDDAFKSRHEDDHQQENDSDDDEVNRSDEERRKRHRKLQKKLKHSAANKIQSQWKKKKDSDDGAELEPRKKDVSEPEVPVAAAQIPGPKESPEHEKPKSEDDAQQDDASTDKKHKKKKKVGDERGGGKGKTAKTVPPPVPEVLEWNRALPVKRARRNVAQGLRVKVRFATKVKRDGKILRKKKWFGGRVSAVSKEGSKIRIKYDDGTAEISKFPDKDVVVCDAFNGEHQCDASKFQPPDHNKVASLAAATAADNNSDHNAGSMVMDEERAPTPPQARETENRQPEKKQSPPPQPAEELLVKPSPESKEPGSLKDERKVLVDPRAKDSAKRPQAEEKEEAKQQKEDAERKEKEPEAGQEGATPQAEAAKPEVEFAKPKLEESLPQAEAAETEPKVDYRKPEPPPPQTDRAPTEQQPTPPPEKITPPITPKELTPPLREPTPPPKAPTPPPREPTPPPKSPTPPPKQPTPPPEQPHIPSPKASPFKELDDEVVRPPSPPIPSESAPPLSPLVERTPAPAVPKLKLSLKSLTQPLSDVTESTNDPKSPGEIVQTEVQDNAETKAMHTTATGIGGIASAIPNESEKPQSKQLTEKPSLEKPLSEKLPLTAVEENASIAAQEERPKDPRLKVSSVATLSADEVEQQQLDSSRPKGTNVENMTRKDDIGRILKEMAEPSKPSLTIRLVNPKKEREHGKEPKSPRIKISAHLARTESEEEEGMLTDDNAKYEISITTEAVTKSAVEKAEKLSVAQKRKRAEDEAGFDDLREPLVKRIHLQRPDVVEKTDEQAEREDEKEQGEPAKLKQRKWPSSQQGDQSTAMDSMDDVDDGPVKMVGRVSAKRVPLFSDEEDEESVAMSNSEKHKETTILQKPKAKPGIVSLSNKAEGGDDVEVSKTLDPVEEPSAFKFDKEKVVLNSRNSAFEAKAPGIDKMQSEAIAPLSLSEPITKETEQKNPNTPTTGAVRSGRRAAQQANERIVSTKQEAEKEGDKEKDKDPSVEKKRKRKEKNDEDSESSNEDVNNWVQCFSCKKWRIIPNHIMISSLPDRWYCHLNVDPKRNNCDAPEQTARTPVVRKKKKKRKLRQRADAAAAEAAALEATTAAKVDIQQEVPATKEKVRARSPPPKEEVKPKEKEQVKLKEKDAAKEKEPSKPKNKEAPPAKSKPPRASPNSLSVGSGDSAIQQRDADALPTKKAKHEKKHKRLPDEPLEPVPAPEVAPPDVVAKGKRGRKTRKEQKEGAKESDQDPGTGSFHGSVASQPAEQDPDNVEWVQCDSCSKWRKLPPQISADELPEVWYCTNNTWNPNSASCDAPEDKADGQQDIGPSIPSPGGSKLSYRNLIFGNARKVNRPVSERTRAAESIFATPSDDSEAAYPTVMYANSSAFAPRGSRANIIEDETHTGSIFDLLQHSNLFAELRGVSRSFNSGKVESAQGKPFMPKFFPRSQREDMKELILRCVSPDSLLLGEEVAEACQTRQFENEPDLEEARKYCTKDVVITLLCELVTEGKVQLVQAFGKDWTVSDWSPRYRLAKGVPNENAEAPPPKTRSMKIAKPWKQKLFTG